MLDAASFGTRPGLAAGGARAPAQARVPAPWLESRRLRLREFVPSDRLQLVRMHGDARLRALLIDDVPLHRHDVCAEFLARLQPLYRRHEGLGIWHAERLVPPGDDAASADPALREMLSPEALRLLARPAPRFAGWFNLMPMPGDPGEIELGARLVPDAWGLGLAHEGGDALLHHAFERLGRARVHAVCHPRHAAVRCCVLALGFEDAGERPYEGAPARWYQVGREAWRALQALPRRERLRRALHRMGGARREAA